MKIENSFEVEAPPESAWELLMDVPRVIPCMPGAELTETVDESHWKATMAVKLGPIALSFLTDVAREEADSATLNAVLSAKAREAKGRGSAQATIHSTLVPKQGSTRIDIVTELALTGAVAQYGRGMVQSVAQQMTASFAKCLQEQLAASASNASGEAPLRSATAAKPKPVSGLRLGLKALLDVVSSRLRRTQQATEVEAERPEERG
jgi:carbon monoxide dehydrogenase subunit G